MSLEVVDLSHFRNISRAQVTLSPRLTLLVGENGQGKTNLLESIYLLLQGRNFRTTQERESVQNGEQVAWLQGRGDILGRPQTWQHRIQREPSKRFHQGLVVPAVLFAPDDVYLAKGSPERRRRFLDLLLSAHDAHYARSLRDYHRILLQRNRALKESAWHGVVEDFTPLLIQEGLYVWTRRQETVAALMPRAARIHQRIAPQETVEGHLKFGGSPDPMTTEADYRMTLDRRRQEERARQTTLVGPHRDDLLLFLNGLDTNTYASQGQLRTLALSLKLATYDWLLQETGMKPVILLDDVLSELDERRRQAILQTVSEPGQQTIVTDTEPRSYAALEPRILRVSQGAIDEWPNSNHV